MYEKRDAASGAVSPPPLKRAKGLKLDQPQDDQKKQKGASTLTIYSWNVNGIESLVQRQITSFFGPQTENRARGNTSNQSKLREVLARYSWPILFFLQEVKIAPADKSTQRAIEHAVARGDDEPDDNPSYKSVLCLPKDLNNARGFGRKMYGVCTLIRSDFYNESIENVREVDWDNEGRVLVCETKANGSCPQLAIFNIYAVNGTDFPYNDINGKVVGTRHDRKLQVHAALQEECRQLEMSGRQVVLAGDLNIARTQLDSHPNLRTYPQQHCINRADFEHRFFSMARNEAEKTGASWKNNGGIGGLGMIDTFRYLHPEQARYTYYPRGRPFGASCDRVDMILISNSLSARLTEAGMEDTPTDRGPSDHVPLYCVLRIRD